MADKPTVSNITSGRLNPDTVDGNFDTLVDNHENLLGRGGVDESSNFMTGDLDLNQNRVRNVAIPVASGDAVNLSHLNTILGQGAASDGLVVVHETFTATAGQVLFTFTDLTYTQSVNNLIVFKKDASASEDGYRRLGPDEYEETSTSSFTLVSAASVGDEILAYIGQTVTTTATQVAADADRAETAATNAAASEVLAEKWAEEAEDVEVETGKYSALHWAAKAEEALDTGASAIGYDNSSSGLTATDVQDAIDELDTTLDGLGTAAVEDVGTDAGDVVQLDGSAKLPAVDGSQLTGIDVGGDLYFGNSETFTSSGTFTVPSGTTEVIVEVQGAGGGGGAGLASYSGGGGGAGGFIRAKVEGFAGSGSETVTVTVGGGGAGSSGSSGANGGSSSFGAYATANGGTGGIVASGGSGNHGSNGVVSIAASDVTPLTIRADRWGATSIVAGAFSALGFAGISSGQDATGFGAGGAGRSFSTEAGGDGSDGKVIVYYE